MKKKLITLPSIRRLTIKLLLAVGANLCVGAIALGNEVVEPNNQHTAVLPVKTVRLLVGFPPGGGTDAIARLLADKLKDELKLTVLVENRPGAGGQLAAQALKNAAPDGSTFFISHDHTISILPLVTKQPGFEPQRDFVPVAGLATFVNAFAVADSTPVKSLDEYLAWARHHSDRAAVGVPAPTSVPEFLVKLLAQKYAIDLVAVPYRGSAPMMMDMLSGQIAAGVGSVPDLIENHKAKKLRVIAVLGAQRQRALPDVPSFSELGLSGFEDLPYYAVFARAGTPQSVLDLIASALAKVIAQPEVQDRLTSWGLTVGFMPQAEITKRERAYTQRWTQIIRDHGFQPN